MRGASSFYGVDRVGLDDELRFHVRDGSGWRVNWRSTAYILGNPHTQTIAGPYSMEYRGTLAESTRDEETWDD